ncbi:MAG: glucose-6-phosphate isomerase family protein [Planctomycetota bacterium]
MAEGTHPFSVAIHPASGLMTTTEATRTTERRLSDMRGMYQDAEATEALLGAGDPLLYRVYAAAVPDDPDHLAFGTTVIEPGQVGDEYFMTKGHYHAVERTAEVYHCLAGRGVIVMETRGGETAEVFLEPGQAAYIPPAWAHRSVNVGGEPFIFFYAMPGGAGHDYAAFADQGFLRIIVECEGVPTIVPNPRRG